MIANRVSARALEPGWTRVLDFVFGLTGLFDRVVVNSKAVADEYAAPSARYRDRLVRIDHGFEPKRSDASRDEARRAFGFRWEFRCSAASRGCIDRKISPPRSDCWRCIRDWHLALAGQGPERARLETLARMLNVAQRVHFTGELESGEAWR